MEKLAVATHRDNPAIAEWIKTLSMQAMQRYNSRFSRRLYDKAIKNRDNRYAFRLANEAIAICGHPEFKLSNTHWSRDAEIFLETFAVT